MIKRPILSLLAAMCLGILCFERPLVAAAATVVMYLLGLVFYKLKPVFIKALLKEAVELPLLPLIFLLGVLLAGRQMQVLPLDLELLSNKNGKAEAVAYGTLESVTPTKKGYRLVLKKVNITAFEENYEAKKLLLYTETADGLVIGNKLRLEGNVRELKRAENPGQYDEYLYYRAKWIQFAFTAASVEITENSCNYIKEGARRLREGLALVYDRLFPDEEAGIVKSIILGDKSSLEEESRDLYQQNGIGHILAISGLHVSMIGGTAFRLLRLCSSPLLPAVALTILLLLAYGFLSDFGISTKRAVGMLCLSLLAKVLGRSYDSVEGCALCGLFILLAEPLQLMQVGFQLSFAAALGIGFFNIEFKKWKTEGRGLGAGLFRTALSGLSPQLVTTPVILKFYYEIPLYSFFINLLVLPCMSLVVGLGLISGFIGFVSVGAAYMTSGAVYYLLKFYKLLCELMLTLPESVLLYGNPGRNRLLVCYGAIAVFFMLADYIGKKRYFYGDSARKRRLAALVLLLVPLAFIKPANPALKISCLSVGQGDCAVLQNSNRSAILIDCGSMTAEGISKYRLEPFLKYSGIDTLEAVIISHPDKDHISGITELLENIDNSEPYRGKPRVKRIIMTKEAYNSYKTQTIRELSAQKGIEINLLFAEDTLIYNSLSLKCLAPTAIEDKADNEGSIVLLASYGSFQALFMGDTGFDVEERLAASASSGAIKTPLDFLKVSHHGSKNSNSEAFISTLQPRIAVISYGRGNVYGHPHQNVLEMLEKAGSLVYKTGAIGAACFEIRKSTR